MRFADIQMLRYNLPGFEALTSSQKAYIYYLSEATLWGRDITFDQFGKYNLLIRITLEAIYKSKLHDKKQASEASESNADEVALETYLKRVWFSNGIYHHYGCEKFVPEFSQDYFIKEVRKIDDALLPLPKEQLLSIIIPVIFNPNLLPKRVNKTNGEDLVATSACNYYEGLTQEEVENFSHQHPLNSTLRKIDGKITEDVWHIGGKYGKTIEKIVENLLKAREYAENEQQKKIIDLLVEYYHSGDAKVFDDYCIEWIKETEGRIDFVNGFIEVYGDPLGIKASWEGIVEYKDLEACRRTKAISDNAQWFEDHSPVAKQFKKEKVRGVIANAVCAAMIGGDEYPSTAIGINLPNAEWIRAQYGSKSVTISNFMKAYDEASKESGFLEEFVSDADTISMIRKYGEQCDSLHTDLHECLGHGSGKLLPGVSQDALKAYGNTIEEARADLFALYYIADEKLLSLGLVPDMEAYKASYYTYIMNGLLTQAVRIKEGSDYEEAHMRNRALIAQWALHHSDGNIEISEATTADGEKKHYVVIKDYEELRKSFGILLAEIQRIKSEGDYEAARDMVETYGVKIDPTLHHETLARYKKLNIAPYKGFINPKMTPIFDEQDKITDVTLDYTETMEQQMMRYSTDYSVDMSKV